MTPRRIKLWPAAAALGALHVAILLAGFIAPHNYATQNRELTFAPPAHIHFVDATGSFHIRPFVYAMQTDSLDASTSAIETSQMYALRFFVPGDPYKIAGIFTARVHLFGVRAPGQVFLMGTDGYGRDQFSRFLYGGQISLLAGLLAAAVSLVIATAIGAMAGYHGGWIDEVLMRSGELFLALPWLYLLFAVRAVLPLHVAGWQVFLLLVAVMGLIGWARPARLIRGVVLSARERNFVQAARGFGASDFYLLTHHILPQASGVILTQLALLIPQYVLAEVTLSFLGLGVSEPTPSWGGLLSTLQQYYVLSSYWWMFLPAILMVPVFLLFYAVANALQERLQSVNL
jgi:peptide/nickel transport system permease protein